jgi:hypothetical protein
MLYLKAGTTKIKVTSRLINKKLFDMVKVNKQNPVSKRNGVLKILILIIKYLHLLA